MNITVGFYPSLRGMYLEGFWLPTVSTENLMCTFLCCLQEDTGGDTSDLYLEEREEQLKDAATLKRQAQLAIPGIINPHDRHDDMQQEQ